jgi:hypothetical protein
MIYRFRRDPPHFLINLGRRSRTEDVGVFLLHFVYDGSHLLRRLSLTVDGFRIAGPEIAVLIDIGKSQVLERQFFQLLQRFLRVDLSLGHLIENIL